METWNMARKAQLSWITDNVMQVKQLNFKIILQCKGLYEFNNSPLMNKNYTDCRLYKKVIKDTKTQNVISVYNMINVENEKII